MSREAIEEMIAKDVRENRKIKVAVKEATKKLEIENRKLKEEIKSLKK